MYKYIRKASVCAKNKLWMFQLNRRHRIVVARVKIEAWRRLVSLVLN